MSNSLKFNGIDLATLPDIELKKLCLKYQIITTSEIQTMNRDKLLHEINIQMLIFCSTEQEKHNL